MVMLLSHPSASDDLTRQEDVVFPAVRLSPADAIIGAITVMHTLQHEQRHATPQEQAILAKWMGWGSVAPAFEYRNRLTGKWKEVSDLIMATIGPDSYKEASAATPNSFFTDTYLVNALWSILVKLGFTGGNVLEIGCGSGHVLAAAPADLPIQMTGIERDLFSASIARERVPQATIINEAVEDAVIVNNSFDAAIGNIPFGEVKIYDPELGKERELSLHNYCLWKIVRGLRNGGIGAVITSRYTLDSMKAEDSHIITLSQRDILRMAGCLLLGVIRLPLGAHKAAHTQVITDILIIQKYQSVHEIDWLGHHWRYTANDVLPGINFHINEYFRTHFSSIVGTPYVKSGPYGPELGINAPEHIEELLSTTIDTVIADIQEHGGRYYPPIDVTLLPDHLVTVRSDGLKEGAYYIREDDLIQVIDGELVSIKKKQEAGLLEEEEVNENEEEQQQEEQGQEKKGKGKGKGKAKPKKKAEPKLVQELMALVRMKDAIMALLDAERDFEQPDHELAPLRATLNTVYDAYVQTYGYLRRSTLTTRKTINKKTGEVSESLSRRLPTAMYTFRKDPDYAIVYALEVYDDETDQAQKADIFSHRVNTPPSRKTHAESPTEAIAICLDQLGMLDLPFIASITHLPEEEVPAYLGDFIYEDPETLIWQISSEYLSGNVKKKLSLAQAANEQDPGRYARNIQDLLAIQPEPLLSDDIQGRLGASWIAAKDIEAFCLETFKYPTTVVYEPVMSSWGVKVPWAGTRSQESTIEWGTSRANAYYLVEQGLNNKVPMIYDTDPMSQKRTKNAEESIAAQEKLSVIQDRFSDWIWEDSERATRLCNNYNDLFHVTIPRTYDGSHLTFPGMTHEWQGKLYDWQLSFIWRMLSSKAALNAHPVGAGKTKTMIASAMVLRQTGLTKKAAIVVPNHLLEQITAEAQQLYPGANILIISRDDLKRERRKIFAAKIATGNYDFVVMTHASFGAIRVHRTTEQAYIDQNVSVYEEALRGLEDDETSKRSIKKLETALANMRQREKQLLDRARHDDGITFEQLGISYVMIDEAHFFKNLGLPTNIDSLHVEPSQRAKDMEMKLRWLEKHNNGKPFASFFTATPMSNSMVEAYVMCWYLNYDLLQAYGLTTVDSFASMFIKFQTNIEVSPDGATFRPKTRPSKFFNLPELQTIIAEFVDIRSPDILSAKRPAKREYIKSIDPSPVTIEFVDSLVERSDTIRHGTVDPTVDNMLIVTTEGRAAALDLSLVGIEEEHPRKLEMITDTMADIYHRWQKEADYLPGEFKSLQIGFCDLGTPSAEKGDQIYGKVKKLLIQRGIPAHGIRFIHEAKTDTAKKILFEQCRTGKVAIILGSTKKMGTGTNIQTRAAALHHLDAPWRPDEVEQREGRVQRPGNLYPVVEIYRYVTKRTFDAYSWQILAIKAVFFDQLRSGRIKARELDQVGDTAMSYAQVKAAATGNPIVMAQATADSVYHHLANLYKSYRRARGRDAQDAQSHLYSVESYMSDIALNQKIIAIVQASEYPGFVSQSGLHLTEREDIGKTIAQLVADNLLFGGMIRIGKWSGVDLFLKIEFIGQGKNQETLIKIIAGDNHRICIRAHPSWIGKGKHFLFVDSLESLFGDMEPDILRYQQEIERHQQEAEEYDSRARIPFPQQQELLAASEKKDKIDQYIDLVAHANEDEEKQREIDALYREIMQGIDVAEEISTISTDAQEKIPPPRRPDEKPLVVVAPALVVEAATVEVEIAEPVIVKPVVVVQIPPQTIIKEAVAVSHKVDLWTLRAQLMVEKSEKQKKVSKKKQKNTSSSLQQTLFSFGDDGEEKHPVSTKKEEERGDLYEQIALF